MASRWTRYEIEQIKRAYPEFKGLQEKPSIDSIVVEFLERYEVYVKPASSAEGRSAGDRLSDGMVAGLGGTAALAANQGLRGQEKNTAVQEWTQWKQWALVHKDFEELRAERVGGWEKFKSRIESDEFAAEWKAKNEILNKEYDEKNKKEGKAFMKVAAVVVVAFIGLCIIVAESDKKKKSNPNTGQILQPVELASELT